MQTSPAARTLVLPAGVFPNSSSFPSTHQGTTGQHQTNCKSPGKAPLWPWKEYQTRLPRPAELHLYWNKCPASNVGLAMGPVSGLIGLDIDGDEGAKLFDSIAPDNMEPTLAFTTGHGKRLLFRWPDAHSVPIKSFAVNGHEALRILGAGSQTVAPPSIHPTGPQYAWLPGAGPADLEPAECPAWLLDAIKLPEGENQAALVHSKAISTSTLSPPGHANTLTRARAYIKACEPAISGQGGHNTTYRLACRLVKGFHLPEEEALQLLLAEFNPRCQPPWTENELRHKVKQAAEKGESPEMLAVPSTNGKHHAPLATSSPPLNKPTAKITTYSEIPPKPIEWLWKSWIPLSKLTMLDGDPGLGKSTLLIDLAARVSTHGVMPDGTQGIAGNVVIMSAEDAPDDTIRPRLEAAGANLNRIHDLSCIVNGEERPPEIPRDLPLIAAKLREVDARLFIVDPLMAFLADVDANKDQSVRRALYQLSKIIEATRTATTCMRHLNKGGGTKAIYRGNSSIGVIGHARAGLLVAADPDNSDKRILAATKVNLGPKPQSLRFSLVPQGNICRIGWEGTSPHGCDDLLVQPPTPEEQEHKDHEKDKLEYAKAIITTLLQDGSGKVAVKIAKDECAAAGIAARTAERAAKQLGLTISQQHVDGIRTYYYTQN